MIGDRTQTELAGRRTGADLQRAASDRRAPVRRCCLRRGSAFPVPPAATRRIRSCTLVSVNGVAAAECQRAVVDERTAPERPRGASVADLQRAGRDRRRPGIGIVGGKDRRARSDLIDGAAAADHAVDDHRVGAVEVQDAVVDDVADDAAARAAVAELQRPGADGRATGVGVVPLENGRPRPGLLQRAAAADVAGDADGIAAVEDQRAVVDDVAEAERAGRAAVADLKRSGGNRRGTGIRVGAGEMVVPAPAWTSAPLPLIALASVTVSLRLTLRVPSLTIAPAPMLPDVPPSPICKVPAPIVVAPV